MEIQEFQEKLLLLTKMAAENENRLTGNQVREFFTGLDLNKEQLLSILKYLKLKGIGIEGMDLSGAEQEADGSALTETEDQTEERIKTKLTEEETAYVREYKEALHVKYDRIQAEKLFRAMSEGATEAKRELSQIYLEIAADMAIERFGREMQLSDLIQEANMALLMALEMEEPKKKDDLWMKKEIQKGIQSAIEAQNQKNFEDDYLVAKVQRLESAVKDLSEDEEGEATKFTVEELAIILDMDLEEIRDVLRLTGDDN